MPKISVFGGVTDVHASGLLPGVAHELPVEVVDRADGTVTEVNSEHDQDATPEPDADAPATGPDPDGLPANSDDPPADPPAGRDLPFDPGDFTVAEVKAKLTDLDDDQREAVLNAELAGKNRAGLTG